MSSFTATFAGRFDAAVLDALIDATIGVIRLPA